jgi:hypothetical protein
MAGAVGNGVNREGRRTPQASDIEGAAKAGSNRGAQGSLAWGLAMVALALTG